MVLENDWIPTKSVNVKLHESVLERHRTSAVSKDSPFCASTVLSVAKTIESKVSHSIVTGPDVYCSVDYITYVSTWYMNHCENQGVEFSMYLEKKAFDTCRESNSVFQNGRLNTGRKVGAMNALLPCARSASTLRALHYRFERVALSIRELYAPAHRELYAPANKSVERSGLQE